MQGSKKKETIIRTAISLAIIIVLVMLWSKQSDLAYNVSQQRDILLGRYTVDHTVTLVFATPILLLVLSSVWKKPKVKDAATKKKDAFKTIALTLSIIFALVFVDVAMRIMERQQYAKDGTSYHRIPNQTFNGTHRDLPEAKFSYPKKATGYPDVSYTLMIDGQGFRNPKELVDCDWLVLGDSFAEGSSVSDEHNWPVLLAEARNVKLYNLGMSGGSPVTYLGTLEKFGLKHTPEAVIYLLYEGNDFRDSNFEEHKLEEGRKDTFFDVAFKNSPIRLLIKRSLVNFLAPVGAKRFYEDPACNQPFHPMYPVAWLPIQVPAEDGNFYAFDLKRVLQHFVTEADFRKTIACTESLRLLGETKQLCDASGIRLFVVYVPDKPHVLMDAITSQIPDKQLYAFLDMKAKTLPPVGQLKDSLNTAVTARESVIAQFCSDSNIEFVNLTEPLQKATAEGTQTYFTYDQHWTPEGHRIVAGHLAEIINN